MKPQPKKEVSVSENEVYPTARVIYFFSTEDAVADFSDFGDIRRLTVEKNKYRLFVDVRLDFQEVLDYLRNYG